jgi:sigma-E factor negative regulatory protein RseB
LRPSIPDFNRHYSLSSPATGAADVGWSVKNVPAGFVLRSQRHTDAGDHLVYSDGLASVSVYVEPRGENVQKSSASRAGAVHARAFVLGDRRVFVIGKVPAATIERFARGVVAVDPR